MSDYPVLIFWSDEDEEYVAVVPDLRGCSASGATIEEAAREIRTAKRLWLEAARDNGFPIPPPTARPALVAAEEASVAR
jgi:predicted RNase H-like HicB family nuclease